MGWSQLRNPNRRACTYLRTSTKLFPNPMVGECLLRWYDCGITYSCRLRLSLLSNMEGEWALGHLLDRQTSKSFHTQM